MDNKIGIFAGIFAAIITAIAWCFNQLSIWQKCTITASVLACMLLLVCICLLHKLNKLKKQYRDLRKRLKESDDNRQALSIQYTKNADEIFDLRHTIIDLHTMLYCLKLSYYGKDDNLLKLCDILKDIIDKKIKKEL